MDDRSLDDFLDAGSDGADGDDNAGADGDDNAGADAGESDAGDDGVGGAGDEGRGELTTDGDGADTEPSADPDAVEPAVSTYVWGAAGTACAACGDSVQRRWRQDDLLVCDDCKEW